MGLRGLRPCVSPRRQAARGPPGDASRHRVAPVGARSIPAYQGAQVAAVWVGTSRPASWACRSATAAGNAMPKHGARVARRRDCAAFGYIDHRAPAACVQRLRPLRWSADWEGCRRCPFRTWRGGLALPGVWGCNPLPWSRPRRRAGRRFAGQGRSALSVQGNPGRISCHPPLVGGWCEI